MREKIQRNNSRREDINSYCMVASQKVLTDVNPWEPLVATHKSTFSEEADTFLVICVRIHSPFNSFSLTNKYNYSIYIVDKKDTSSFSSSYHYYHHIIIIVVVVLNVIGRLCCLGGINGILYEKPST